MNHNELIHYMKKNELSHAIVFYSADSKYPVDAAIKWATGYQETHTALIFKNATGDYISQSRMNQGVTISPGKDAFDYPWGTGYIVTTDAHCKPSLLQNTLEKLKGDSYDVKGIVTLLTRSILNRLCDGLGKKDGCGWNFFLSYPGSEICSALVWKGIEKCGGTLTADIKLNSTDPGALALNTQWKKIADMQFNTNTAPALRTMIEQQHIIMKRVLTQLPNELAKTACSMSKEICRTAKHPQFLDGLAKTLATALPSATYVRDRLQRGQQLLLNAPRKNIDEKTIHDPNFTPQVHSWLSQTSSTTIAIGACAAFVLIALAYIMLSKICPPKNRKEEEKKEGRVSNISLQVPFTAL